MTINEIRDKLKETGYIPTDDICYAVFGMLALNKPLLVEGAPGVGKTSLACMTTITRDSSLPWKP